MKPMTVSIFSVTNREGDGFHPAWRGGRGDELEGCPFSFDEGQDGAESGDGAAMDVLLRSYDAQAKSYNGSFLEGADFSRRDGTRADFSFAMLRMADFNRANLLEAKFRFADLTFANFEQARLVKADLSFADLCKAGFRGARLAFADLTGADLEYADFSEADLRGAVFADVDCRSARFAGAVFDTRTVLPFAEVEARRQGMIEAPPGGM